MEINSVEQLKKLGIKELDLVADDIRNLILDVTSKQLGHVGPNLGIVEATIALHYVFNSPVDKIIWDVSHQSYAHKIITGRREIFRKMHLEGGTKGYTDKDESEHDFFNVGHTSSSISLASGFQKARDLSGGNENIIAVIGDGSLSGGPAFEGLNAVGKTNTNFIVVMNDNQMSIAENAGGIYKNLSDLRNGTAKTNYFTALGFEYSYVKNGNSIPDLIKAFSEVKDSKKPVVVHINTVKGKGFSPAENNKEMWHYSSSKYNPKTGELVPINRKYKMYNVLYEEFLSNEIEDNKKSVVAMYPGTPFFSKSFREKYKNNFVDNAIAEAHQISFSSGISSYPRKNMKAYGLIFSSFVQRAYDQLSQDLALNKSPATMVVLGAGISNSDQTHLGIFDIPLISNIPNIVYLEPANKNDFAKMLDFCKNYKDGPSIIRANQFVSNEEALDFAGKSKVELNKSEEVYGHVENSDILLLGLGQFLQKALDVKNELENYKVSVVNPRFISALDKELLEKFNGKIVATFESGQIDGGFGQKVSEFFNKKGIKALNFGANKEFTNGVPMNVLEEKLKLVPKLAGKEILKNI